MVLAPACLGSFEGHWATTKAVTKHFGFIVCVSASLSVTVLCLLHTWCVWGSGVSSGSSEGFQRKLFSKTPLCVCILYGSKKDGGGLQVLLVLLRTLLGWRVLVGTPLRDLGEELCRLVVTHSDVLTRLPSWNSCPQPAGRAFGVSRIRYVQEERWWNPCYHVWPSPRLSPFPPLSFTSVRKVQLAGRCCSLISDKGWLCFGGGFCCRCCCPWGISHHLNNGPQKSSCATARRSKGPCWSAGNFFSWAGRFGGRCFDTVMHLPCDALVRSPCLSLQAFTGLLGCPRRDAHPPCSCHWSLVHEGGFGRCRQWFQGVLAWPQSCPQAFSIQGVTEKQDWRFSLCGCRSALEAYTEYLWIFVKLLANGTVTKEQRWQQLASW